MSLAEISPSQRAVIDHIIGLCREANLSIVVGFTLDADAKYPWTSHQPPQRTAIADCNLVKLPEHHDAWIIVPAVDDDGEWSAFNRSGAVMQKEPS